jgi:hypothetical protein
MFNIRSFYLQLMIQLELQEVNPREAITPLGEGMEIIKRAGDFEITDGSSDYEVLCAWKDHPYCRDAEWGFLLIDDVSPDFHEQTREKIKDQNVCIYLRDKDTLEVKPQFFNADLHIKKLGVNTAIVVSPTRLKGLLCTPAEGPNGAYWVVYRPYNPSNVLELKVAPPHIRCLPTVRFRNTNIADSLEHYEFREFDFEGSARKGIISIREINSQLEEIKGVSVKISQKKEATSPDQYELIFEGVGTLENPHGICIVLFECPFKWPRGSMDDEIIQKSYMMSLGYFEFVVGRIVKIQDKSYIKLLDTPTYPHTQQKVIFQPSQTKIAQAIKFNQSLIRRARRAT